MTTVSDRPDTARVREVLADPSARRDLLEHAAILAALIYWAVPFTKATGGRGVHSELVFAVLLFPVLAVLRVWRAPVRSVVFSAVVAVAALLVCVFAPSGWYGSDAAVGYVLAAAVYLAARRYVSDEDRRSLIAAVICLAAMYEFSHAFLSWWGTRDSAQVMTGTFFWRNPYAAFLLPGAVVGLGLVAGRRRPWAIIGWFSVPLCTAGIVFSSSRATLAVLGVAALASLVAVRRDRPGLLRTGGVIALAAAVTAAMPGPPLFPRYQEPFTATLRRSQTVQTLSHNGADRAKFWWSAIKVFAHHPFSGAGYHTLATASAFYTPSGWPRSALVHNGYLQPLTDGGLLLAIPFDLAALVILWWGLRAAWRSLRDGAGASAALGASLSLALLGALAHSAVDFDWTHPSILIECALLAACVAPTGSTRARLWVSGTALLALGGVLAVSIPALHRWQTDQPIDSYSSSRLLSESAGTFGDYRPARLVLDAYVNGSRELTRAQVAEALSLTANDATVDIHVALLRDAAGAVAGLYPDALERAQVTLGHVDGSIAPYVPDLALVQLDVGDNAAAAQLLKSDIAGQSARNAAAPDLQAELAMWARRLGTGVGYACVVDQARPLLQAEGLPEALMPATAACPAGGQGHG